MSKAYGLGRHVGQQEGAVIATSLLVTAYLIIKNALKEWKKK